MPNLFPFLLNTEYRNINKTHFMLTLSKLTKNKHLHLIRHFVCMQIMYQFYVLLLFYEQIYLTKE